MHTNIQGAQTPHKTDRHHALRGVASPAMLAAGSLSREHLRRLVAAMVD